MACDAEGAKCIGYTHRHSDDFCSLHGAGLEQALPSGWMARLLSTKDVAMGSGHAGVDCVLRSTYVASRVLPQEADFRCVTASGGRGETAELLGGAIALDASGYFVREGSADPERIDAAAPSESETPSPTPAVTGDREPGDPFQVP